MDGAGLFHLLGSFNFGWCMGAGLFHLLGSFNILG